MRPILLLCGVIPAAALLLLPAGTFAHESWISRNRLTDPISGEWCCNHIDCAEVQKDGLREVAGGYLVTSTGEVITYQRVIWRSPDGAWWRCRNLRTNATRCLIGPPPGS